MTFEDIKDAYAKDYLTEEEYNNLVEKSKKCTFRMNVNEYFRYNKFAEAHKDCRVDRETGRHKFGTIGGGLSVSFMSTGLGDIITVKCHACGEELDITDVDCW